MTLLAIYLWINAVLYGAFTAWCTLAPGRTASFMGLEPVNAGGRTEYLAIYGGLQAGLALFYLLAALTPGYRRVALVFSLCLYAGIVLFRSSAALREGFGQLHNAWFAYSLELTLLLAALALVWLRAER